MKQCQCGKRLNEASFTADHIIIGGDFNHFEKTNHRGIAGECKMNRKEAVAWHHMILQYGLSNAWKLDNFRKMTAKEFTFDNGRSGPSSTVLHIDKFSISQNLDTQGRRIEAAISIRKLLDHSPLVLTIWGWPIAPDRTNCYFDPSVLGD
jgi:exonuclease III